MDEEPPTLEQIQQRGFAALVRELGPTGMIRFLQQFETGHGNYSRDRHQWLTQLDVQAIADKIRQQREAT